MRGGGKPSPSRKSSFYRNLRGGRQRLSLCLLIDDNFWEFHLSLALQCLPYKFTIHLLWGSKAKQRHASHLLGYFLTRAGSCSWVGNKVIFPLISPLSHSLQPQLAAAVLICRFTSTASLPPGYSYMKEKENPHGTLFSQSQTGPL